MLPRAWSSESASCASATPASAGAAYLRSRQEVGTRLSCLDQRALVCASELCDRLEKSPPPPPGYPSRAAALSLAAAEPQPALADFHGVYDHHSGSMGKSGGDARQLCMHRRRDRSVRCRVAMCEDGRPCRIGWQISTPLQTEPSPTKL